MTTRLYFIISRTSPKAVVFRRGPSKRVCIISWNLKDDSFEPGQWFKGRIYERRCDLSPDGKYLGYFAATYKEPLLSWTAISKPPYLTALALWPKGDGWGGGGLFKNQQEFLLNHKPDEEDLHADFSLPKNLNINSFGEYAGHGEDDPIHHTRLLRDGWIMKSKGKKAVPKFNTDVTWDYSKDPVIYEKVNKNNSLKLQMQIKGLHKRGGSWYLIDHFLYNNKNNSPLSLTDTDWADWDHNGDLVYAQDGKLFRVKIESASIESSSTRKIADFSQMKFEEVIAPDWAKKWD